VKKHTSTKSGLPGWGVKQELDPEVRAGGREKKLLTRRFKNKLPVKRSKGGQRRETGKPGKTVPGWDRNCWKSRQGEIGRNEKRKHKNIEPVGRATEDEKGLDKKKEKVLE